MKESKDIFDLFRDNENKLNRPPSNRAWERLENRLDNHRSQQEHRIRRRPSPWRNVLSMAGVLLVLVAMISAISLIMKNQSVAKTAMNESTASPMFVLEEIGIYSDQIKNPHNIGLYEKQLKRLNTNPFLEGDPSKELRVQRKVYRDNLSRYQETNQSLAMNRTATTSASNIERPNDDIATTDSSIDAEMENQPSTSVQSMKMKDESTEAAAMPPVSQMANEGLPKSISAFSWLNGEWVSKLSDNSSSSVEIWEDGNDVLTGKAYLVEKGQKQLVETMKLEELRGEILFTLKIIEEGRQRRYTLKSFSDREIRFENIQLPFPNQIIFQLNDSKTQFTGILKHRSEIEPRAISEALLSPRHVVEEDQVKRVMVKSATDNR